MTNFLYIYRLSLMKNTRRFGDSSLRTGDRDFMYWAQQSRCPFYLMTETDSSQIDYTPHLNDIHFESKNECKILYFITCFRYRCHWTANEVHCLTGEKVFMCRAIKHEQKHVCLLDCIINVNIFYESVIKARISFPILRYTIKFPARLTL
jgi:hypothetical protein